MKARLKDKMKCGIYCIRNNKNGKVYIGKSINIHQRIIQHRCQLNKQYGENDHLLKAWFKHGGKNFEYIVLEYLEPDEILVAKRELYWMKIYNSGDSDFGYNKRMDSDSKMIVHRDTRNKISERVRKEYSEGKRKDHGKKLKANWDKNSERKEQQRGVMRKALTKWEYELYNLNHELLYKVKYAKLKELKLHNCIAEFSVKKTDFVKFKKHFIKRVRIEDIV